MNDQRLCAYTSCHSGLLEEDIVTVLSGKIFNIENGLRERKCTLGDLETQ